MTQKLKFVMGRVANMGKGENAALPAFSPFSKNVFKSFFFSRGIKSWACVLVKQNENYR